MHTASVQNNSSLVMFLAIVQHHPDNIKVKITESLLQNMKLKCKIINQQFLNCYDKVDDINNI